jgi:hypothetical protein
MTPARRTFGPLLAAVLVLAMTAAGCDADSRTAGGETDDRDAPAVRTPPVGALNAPLPDELAGLSAKEAERIRTGCVEQSDFRGDTGDVRLRALTEDRARLLTGGRPGRLAALVGSGVVMICSLADPGEVGNDTGVSHVSHRPVKPSTGVAAHWLVGPVQIDLTVNSLPPGGGPEVDSGGYDTLIGRVGPGVAKVVVRGADGLEVTVPVTNGTYVAQLFYPKSGADPLERRPSVAHALSRDGVELGENDGVGAECFTDPAGAVVVGDPNLRPCGKAVAWR